MKILQSIFLSLIFIPMVLIGQKFDNTASFRDIKSDNYIRLHHDNDVFYSTDENYTQGINIELVSKKPYQSSFYFPKKQ